MRYARSIRHCALFTAMAFAGGIALAQNVATVNSKPIPKAREDAWVQELTRQGQADTPELRKQVKDKLIQDEILLQEALRRGVAERADVKFALDVQRQNLLVQALIREEIEKTPITDAQIKAAYDTLRQNTGDREFRARHILVEKEDEARSIIEQVRKGARFEDLATKTSRDAGSAKSGGELGWAAPGSYVKPFADALIKLSPGQMTEAPVQTQFGWHVIRLEETRETQFLPLEKVAPQIREGLAQQRAQAFVESLRKNAKVQ